MENPEILLSDLVATDAWIRTLARHLVRTDEDAQDVAQEAWVRYLAHRPHQRGPVRRWLTTVLRNLAVSRRRADSHRIEREQAAARPEELPSVAELWDQEQLRRRIANAVFALEEPYRTSILLRYFRGHSRAEIAAQLGVSAAAIETRLRRGLEKLRARLDRDCGDRRAWCTALLGLIRPDVPAAAAGASSIAAGPTLAGALLMSTEIKIAFGVATIVLAACALAFWPRGEEQVPPETVAEAPKSPSSLSATSTSAAAVQEPARESTDAASLDQAAADRPPVGQAPEVTTVKGRCVDAATGQPLAGCTVTLAGEPHDEVDVENHVARHGRIRWDPPEARVTDADGLFTFTVSPPPPFTFVLRVARPDRVPMVATWPSLELGKIEDLGDVSMSTGVPLDLRVVNLEGTPQAGVQVHLWRWPPVQGDGALPDGHAGIQTGADGAGRCAHPVLPGTWKVSLANRQLEGPEEIVVADHVTDRPHEIMVRTVRTITGVILDPSGQPVFDATVQICPYDSRVGHRTRTLTDGSFRIEASADAPGDPVALSVVKDGFDLLWGHGSYPWGATDVRLVIQRGLPVEVRVCDGGTGAPVEAFGVRCLRESPPTAHLPDDPERLQLAGRHAGGLLVLPAVRRGTNLLMVEPLESRYAPSRWVRVAVGESAATICQIQLWPNVQRPLQVVDSQGRPVPGTEIELLRPAGDESVRLDSPAGAPSLLRYNNHDQLCLLLQHGSTDEGGELLLSGPGNERLAVRILGPGHPPFVVNDVVLDPALGPLRVETTAASCRLRGMLHPPAALSRLGPAPAPWQHAARRADVLDRSAAGAGRPAVQLARDTTAPVSKNDLRTLVVPVGEDGRFCFSGVPAGTWTVHLLYSMPAEDGRGGVSRKRLLGTVGSLRDGEERDLVFDVSGVFPGRLTGTVVLNGRPLPKERVSFPALTQDRAGRSHLVVTNRSTWTDSRGAFSIDLEPGVYRLRLENRNAAGRGAAIASDDTVEIPPGLDIHRDFQLACARLELRVLGSDGKSPVSGVSLYSEIPSQQWRFYTRKTDREGRIVFDRVPTGTIRFAVWPRHMQTPAARSAFLEDHPRTWREELPSLGTVEIPVGISHVAQELVMPPESGY
ncbi:MAG: sigma-70 family RNA polymerase sigma factor [Planctomycetes bacterium]|nr:sigma-70 family RNA polymerase sigma factor [Planctomycetota bacterium]